MRTRMGKRKSKGLWLLFGVLLGALLIFQRYHKQHCVVSEIVDGDTILCADGFRVRLLGVDAPEAVLNRRVELQLKYFGSVERVLKAGKEAKEFLESLTPPGTRLQLEYDVEKKDRYGRILAYAWLPDGRMVNETLLREGYALLLVIPPNEKYRITLTEAYLEAQRKKKGLWRYTTYPFTSTISPSTLPFSSFRMPIVFTFA